MGSDLSSFYMYFLNFIVVCYFQRCQNIETQGWVCNYHGKGVKVECQPDEVCFEESNTPAIFYDQKPLLLERNCRATAIIDGEIRYLKPWLDYTFPDGNGGYFSEITRDEKYFLVGDVDLCNNVWALPPSFQIARNSK